MNRKLQYFYCWTPQQLGTQFLDSIQLLFHLLIFSQLAYELTFDRQCIIAQILCGQYSLGLIIFL